MYVCTCFQNILRCFQNSVLLEFNVYTVINSIDVVMVMLHAAYFHSPSKIEGDNAGRHRSDQNGHRAPQETTTEA